MALNLPSLLTILKPKDPEAQRYTQQISGAVNPVLGFLRSSFDNAQNGALRIIRSVVLQSLQADTATANTLNVNTAANVSGTLNATGTTNVSGVANLTGGVNTPSGFKSTYDMGVSYASSASAGTRYQTKRFTQNSEGTTTYNSLMLFQPIFAGSIIGIHMYSLGTAGGNLQVQLYKYQTQVGPSTTITVQTPAVTAGQFFGNYVTYPKGMYSFITSDYYAGSATFTVAGNQFVQVTLVVEYAA